MRDLYSKGHLQSLFADIVFSSQDDIIVWHDLQQRLRRANLMSLPQDKRENSPAESSLPAPVAMDRWRQQTEQLGRAVSSVRRQWRRLRSDVQQMCSRVLRDFDEAPASIVSKLKGDYFFLKMLFTDNDL